jgi:hypothetical protein
MIKVSQPHHASLFVSLQNSSLCVASQLTLAEIDLLIPFVNAAPGAISVAISLAREDLVAALAVLKYLRSCSASLRHKVIIHSRAHDSN